MTSLNAERWEQIQNGGRGCGFGDAGFYGLKPLCSAILLFSVIVLKHVICCMLQSLNCVSKFEYGIIYSCSYIFSTLVTQKF